MSCRLLQKGVHPAEMKKGIPFLCDGTPFYRLPDDLSRRHVHCSRALLTFFYIESHFIAFDKGFKTTACDA
jgi:hypothetical protein